jgi:peptidoglycan hydrolase CwlO-like protein
MQLTRNRFGKTRKALATGIAAAILVSGVGATSAHADATTDAIAEVKTSVTAVNDNVKLLAAQVTTLQAAVATLIDSFGDQLNEILATQATLIATLAKIQAQITALQKASAKKK